MNPEVIPPYLLVDYAWEVLKLNMPDVWDESKYGGLVPVVPLSEEPELDEFDGPHIVYGYADDPTGDLFAMSGGALTFALYDQNFRRLSKTLNVLKATFERQDQAAKDVNQYSTERHNGAFVGIRFGSISIAFVEGGTPEEQEGARQSALIGITYSYFADYQVITTPTP